MPHRLNTISASLTGAAKRYHCEILPAALALGEMLSSGALESKTATRVQMGIAYELSSDVLTELSNSGIMQ